jgi:predicted N-acyltransferase
VSVTVSVEPSLTAISEREWAELAGGASFYAARPWVLALAEYERDLESFLVLARDGGELLGALPGHLVRPAIINPLYNLFDLFGRPGGLPEEARSSWAPQLVGGPTSGYANALLVRSGLTAERRRAAVGALVRGFAELARATGAACAAIPFLDRPDLDEIRPHMDPAALTLLTLPSATLPVPGRSYDNYYRALRASRRRMVRAELDAFAASGCILRRAGLGETIGTIAPLLAGVQRSHGSSLATVEFARYLERCAAHGLDEQATVFLAGCGEDVVAFSMGYRHGSTLYMRVVGMEHGRDVTHVCYRNAFFHEPIRFAAEHGLERIDYGVMAYRPKLIRGCVLRSLWSALIVEPGVTTDSWWTTMGSHNESWRARWTDELAGLARPAFVDI